MLRVGEDLLRAVWCREREELLAGLVAECHDFYRGLLPVIGGDDQCRLQIRVLDSGNIVEAEGDLVRNDQIGALSGLRLIAA